MSVRLSLEALKGETPGSGIDADAMTAEFREATKRRGDYEDRMELVRKSLKFAADLGAHPDSGETYRAEALALLHMAAGLMQWLNRA